MIRHYTHSQIDKIKWDECIRNAFNGNVYAFSWYLDIVAYGWEALVEGDYETVFPLTRRRKFFTDYLYQPLFTQQLGIFSVKRLNSEVVQRFLDSIPAEIRYGRFNLNRHNKPMEKKGLRVEQRVNIELPLMRPMEDIRRKYSLNTRRNIRKAEKDHIYVADSIKPDHLVHLFRNNMPRRGVRWNDRDYRVLNHLLYTLVHKGAGFTRGVYSSSNQLLAAAFFTYTHQRIVLLLSAVSLQGRLSGAMHFLIDDTLARMCTQAHILDFEGSQDQNLARFYKSFGSEVFYYPCIELDRLPWLITKLYHGLR